MNNPENISVTPWFTKQEWIKVAYCIVTATDSKIAEKHFQDDTDFKDYSSRNQIELYLKAIEDIDVWKTRTNKLPAGVETTLCLLHGAITYAKSTDNSIFCSRASLQLCLATAINRFLNLICHTGFNLFGLTKYYDVAEKFSIPDWIVEVRHETAHGHMPSEELLLEALAFSLKWIVLNYWVPEYKNQTCDLSDSDLTNEETYIKNTAIYKKINKLFDCYRYLKLYTIWDGVQKVSDLKDQDELYEHVMEHLEVLLPTTKTSVKEDTGKSGSNGENKLIHQKSSKKNKKKNKQSDNDASTATLRTELNDLKIGSAMNLIQDKIFSIICSLNSRQNGSTISKIDCHKAIILNLVSEELMLPSRDFFNSLTDHSSDSASSEKNVWSEEYLPENLSLVSSNSHFKPMKLPKDLVSLWADILHMIVKNGTKELLSDLLYELHEASGGSNTDFSDRIVLKRCLASAWIVEICESLSSSSCIKSSYKDSKNKKQSKNQKEKRKEHGSNLGRLKFNGHGNVTEKEFQESFCRRVIMNPLSPLTMYHLPSVLLLTVIDEKQSPISEQPKSVEHRKKRILQLFCMLFGIKENVPKLSASNLQDINDEIHSVHSISDHIKSLKRPNEDSLDDTLSTPSKVPKQDSLSQVHHKVNQYRNHLLY